MGSQSVSWLSDPPRNQSLIPGAFVAREPRFEDGIGSGPRSSPIRIGEPVHGPVDGFKEHVARGHVVTMPVIGAGVNRPSGKAFVTGEVLFAIACPSL